MKSRSYKKKKVHTEDEMLFRILDAATRIKEGKDQLRRTTGDLCTRVVKCIEVDDGIFENLL
jgi:hypothetical protein